MCIVCSDYELADKYLKAIWRVRDGFKDMEHCLLELSKMYPDRNYGKAHKELVRVRKSLHKVEDMRERNPTKNK